MCGREADHFFAKTASSLRRRLGGPFPLSLSSRPIRVMDGPNLPDTKSAKGAFMARVTVEDCIDKVDNRFELVLLASHRARQISQGAAITVDRDRDKNPVVALREIADEKLAPEDLREDLIHSLQKHVEVDEPEVTEAPALADQASTQTIETTAEDDDNISFDRMSEEDLLAGIEGLVPPEKNDDF